MAAIPVLVYLPDINLLQICRMELLESGFSEWRQFYIDSNRGNIDHRVSFVDSKQMLVMDTTVGDTSSNHQFTENARRRNPELTVVQFSRFRRNQTWPDKYVKRYQDGKVCRDLVLVISDFLQEGDL